jgi:N-acetylmuramoyl-L-alanine amidase
LKKSLLFILSFFSFYLGACVNQKPFKASNKIYKSKLRQIKKENLGSNKDLAHGGLEHEWINTVNFNERKPQFVIIHHTAQQSCDQTIKTFTMQKTQVSSHYLICKEGKIIQMLPDMLRSWHAGTGAWASVKDMNSASIGIEIDNNGFEQFTENQMASLLGLLKILKEKYKIPAENFLGHSDWAPTRKNDPNVNFDWDLLAKGGYGRWYTDSTVSAPVNFEPKVALNLIGYRSTDSLAINKTFNRKYLKKNSDATLSNTAIKILYNLYIQILKGN